MTFLTHAESSLPADLAADSTALYSDAETRARTISLFASPFGSFGLPIFGGRIIWEGPVDVFAISGHPNAKRAYAWSHKAGPNDSEDRFIAVLEIPPVNSAQAAVKVAIANEVRESQRN